MNSSNFFNHTKRSSVDRPESSSCFAAVVEQYLDGRDQIRDGVKRKPGRRSLAERLRSYPPPQEDLDLHGLTAEEAERAVNRFIQRCREINLATLRIITGKGLHSPGLPVLPAVAEATLEGLKQERMVLDFRWENKKRGRESGALIVFLPLNRD